MKRHRARFLIALLCASFGAFGQDANVERETKAIATLNSNVDAEQKSSACRELGHVGSATAVPALVALLPDEKLNGAARYGLEQIGGEAADAALRTALGTLKGTQQAGVIDSLGARRDVKAVGALSALLNDIDPFVAQAAARALGAIGTEDAAKALGGALTQAQGAQQKAVCEGAFRCAESLAEQGKTDAAIALYDAVRALPQTTSQIRFGALRGAILLRKTDGLPLLAEAMRSPDWNFVQAAARIALVMPGAVNVLADEIGKAPVDRQLIWSGVLGQRRDAAAVPALISLAKAGEKTARVAAIKALGEIADGGTVATLIALLNDLDAGVAQAASTALSGFRDAELDDAVIKAIGTADTTLKLKLLDVVGQRRMLKAMPTLNQLMDDADGTVRLTAIRTYGELAGMAELPGLLARLDKKPAAGEMAALEKALGTVCGSAEDAEACVAKLAEALGKSAPETKPALLRTLHVMGSASALKAVQAAVADANKDVHTAAVRVIGEWRSPEAVPVILNLAKTAEAPVDRILALRGCLGLASQPTLAADVRMSICQEAAPLIQRPEEKRLLLAAVSSLADARALSLITPYLDDAAVKQETVLAVLTLCQKRAKKQHVTEARAALEKVKSATTDAETTKRVNQLLAHLE